MRTILVADDVDVNRKILNKILLNNLVDIEIVECMDGAEVLEAVEQQDIYVIVMDIMMPKKNGIEVLAELKNNKKFSIIPVIMCSALSDMEVVEKALSLGALDYFTKPLTQEDMRVLIPLKVKNALEVFTRELRIRDYYDHIKEEMVLAMHLQKYMFVIEEIHDGIEVCGRYLPCEEMGGDLLCVEKIHNSLWFIIADVSGHGLASAMLSNMLSFVFKIKAELCQSTAELLGELNRYLCSVFENSNFGLASAFVGKLEDGILSYSNAGHPYPFFYNRKEKQVEELALSGFLLGFLKDTIYEEHSKIFDPQDVLLMYTDGIFDKGSEEDYIGWEKVRTYFEKNIEKDNDVETFVKRLLHTFVQMDQRSFVDDVSVFVVKNKKGECP